MYSKNLLAPYICCVCILIAALPAQSQATNPTVATCGLPASGTIVADVTYTLTADCTQTAQISINDGLAVTINGGGYEIDAATLSDVSPIIWAQDSVTLSINNATLIGGGKRFPIRGALHMGESALNLTNVTMQRWRALALRFRQGSRTTGTLNSVLFEDGIGLFNDNDGFGSVMDLANGAMVTATNIVVRDVNLGNAAFTVTYHSSLTLAGCLTMERIFPQNFHVDPAHNGSMTDNSTGKCSGTIGNGDSATKVAPEPTPTACGLPAQGFIGRSTTYNLNGTCVQTGPLYFPVGVNVTINGNWHSITSNGFRASMLYVAGGFTMSKVTMRDHNFYPLYSILDKHRFAISETTFSRIALPVHFRGSQGTLSKIIIEDFDVRWANWTSAIHVTVEAEVAATDVILRRNQGRVLLDVTQNSSLTIEGCYTNAENTPDTVSGSGAFTDNSTGPCPEFDFPEPSLNRPDEVGLACNPHCYVYSVLPLQPATTCDSRDDIEALPLGSVACVFRLSNPAASPVLSVYGIDENSAGFHLLTVAQWQVEAAAGEAVIGVSPDGRALLVKWPDGNLTIKVGPDEEGKLLHLTLEGGLSGRVLEFLTTYGPAPGLPYLGRDLSRAVNTVTAVDGSLAPSATSAFIRRSCFATTNYILNLRQQPGGEVIDKVPYLNKLTVMARMQGWFQVDFHGVAGWLAADMVKISGDCGASG